MFSLCPLCVSAAMDVMDILAPRRMDVWCCILCILSSVSSLCLSGIYAVMVSAHKWMGKGIQMICDRDNVWSGAKMSGWTFARMCAVSEWIRFHSLSLFSYHSVLCGGVSTVVWSECGELLFGTGFPHCLWIRICTLFADAVMWTNQQ